MRIIEKKEKSSEDILILQKVLGHLDFFKECEKNLPSFLMEELYKKLKKFSLPAGSTVFKISNNFFI